ncbi:Methyl-CpG-binding domain protein 5 [Ophidiomyces ophidiicola]|nr:Methyl-CpG-binding domain protein 5 [Ophidiomyces ophidiicola]
MLPTAKHPTSSRLRDRSLPRSHASDCDDNETPAASTASRPKIKARRRRSSHGTARRASAASGKHRVRRPDTAHRSSTSSLRKDESSMPGVDASYAASLLSSRAGRPYPAFSKSHCKEAVGSRENVDAGINILTPEPTDIAGEKTTDDRPSSRNKNNQAKRQSTATNATRPPSPPLTNDENQPSRRSTPSVRIADTKGAAKAGDDIKKPKSRPHSTRSSSSLKRVSSEHARKNGEATPRPSTPSSKFKIFDAFQLSHRSPAVSLKQKQQAKDDKSKRSSKARNSMSSTSSVSDDATVLGPKHSSMTSHQKTSSSLRSKKSTGRSGTSTGGGNSSPPNVPPFNEREITPVASVLHPPPPPTHDASLTAPKVDYLLQTGGLHYTVPRNFLSASGSPNVPQESVDPVAVGARLFEPFSRLLDDYGAVLSKRGSLAVATGYRSVARRLLDRLEAVFARDISQEVCECVMCAETDLPDEGGGVSWGEVLELVSGRSELPPWPPFQIHTEPDSADIGGPAHIPMQKLDIDVPKALREHYIQQSRKTKQAVDDWLSRQAQDTASAPEMIDDETLAFAMLTYLNPEQRELFSKFLELPNSPPLSKSTTSNPRTRPEALVLGGVAIQRLYRLTSEPRDPDTALYMVNNPSMHHVLATLSAISNDEWDILISGRFDGFLRSGAEDHLPQSSMPAASWNGKRGMPRGVNGSGVYPASQLYGRRHGAASFGAPISVDEENEIAALAEIERNIYVGMEALEDAFEALHYKAESIRTILRERNASLTVANQARRGGLGSLGSANGAAGLGFSNLAGTNDCETDDGIDDTLSSIAPSESASNISSSRRRRPKRRTERRTPSVVGEENEDEVHYLNIPKRTSTTNSGRRR